MTISQSEWNQRVLCADGNCIGIVGPDGRCKECGLAYEGQLPAADEALPAAGNGNSEQPTVATDDQTVFAEAEHVAETPPAGGDKWADRTLCIDGNCIGTVGADGRCKICNTPHPDKQP